MNTNISVTIYIIILIRQHLKPQHDKINKMDSPHIGKTDPREHYENTPMQYTAIFHGCTNHNFQLKMFDHFHVQLKMLFYHFHVFAQNIDCGYMLEPAHNLCFKAKNRK